MKFSRYALALLVVPGAVVAVSCGDYEPAPQAPTPESVVAAGIGTTLNGLLTCSKLTPEVATKVIGPAGGVIHVGPHKLKIPAYALRSNVTIKATISAENVSRIRLEPHGLEFVGAAELTMSYKHCGLAATVLPMRIAYVTPGLSVLQHLPSVPDIANRKVTAYLRHFSDYAVEAFSLSDHVIAWGSGATR